MVTKRKRKTKRTGSQLVTTKQLTAMLEGMTEEDFDRMGAVLADVSKRIEAVLAEKGAILPELGPPDVRPSLRVLR